MESLRDYLFLLHLRNYIIFTMVGRLSSSFSRNPLVHSMLAKCRVRSFEGTKLICAWSLLLRIAVSYSKKVLPSHWKDLSMSTVRNRMIHHGSSIEIIDGVIKIRLNRSFPYQSEVRETLETLRQQVKIQQAVSDKKRFEP